MKNWLKKKKQPEIGFLCLDKSMIINFDGNTFTINAGDPRYDKVKDCLIHKDLEQVKEILVNFPDLNHSDLEVINDEYVKLDGEILPDALSMRLIQYMKEDLPYDSLIKFARKLRQNPSLNSRRMLYAFLEHNGHPITKDGNFIAYRGVTEDFKDQRTKKFDNSVGSTCEMPRSEVDDNPNNTCSNGLHVACHSYAQGFSDQVVEVEVDPIDVVCVPNDYNGTKMRVCKFKVVAVSKGIRNETVYKGGA